MHLSFHWFSNMKDSTDILGQGLLCVLESREKAGFSSPSIISLLSHVLEAMLFSRGSKMVKWTQVYFEDSRIKSIFTILSNLQAFKLLYSHLICFMGFSPPWGTRSSATAPSTPPSDSGPLSLLCRGHNQGSLPPQIHFYLQFIKERRALYLSNHTTMKV